MDDELYVRFQDRFRGSREEIKDRLKAYLPIIEPLKTIYPDKPAIDLGCGRGEWLELLQENGWQAMGVDVNKSMVSHCERLGLSTINDDAIKYLHAVKPESVPVISGFHIAEHLTFELLLELIKNGYRTLLPGGFLILETPNPENALVSSLNFYLDPTHQNPLPPLLMQFLAEDSCFYKSVIMRVNGPNEPGNNMPLSSWVTWAAYANRDYALVAQKKTDTDSPEFTYYDSLRSEQVIFFLMVANIFNQYENQLIAVNHMLSAEQSDQHLLKNELNSVLSELNTIRNELSAGQSD